MKKVIIFILKVIYFPVYVAFWFLHKVARLVLAISYFGLFEFNKGYNVIKYIFN